MAGYQSARTGQATEALLNRAENAIIPNNGTNDGSFATLSEGKMVIIKSVDGKTVTHSSRVTETNAVIATTDFNSTSNQGCILVVSGTNGIAPSSITASNLMTKGSASYSNDGAIPVYNLSTQTFGPSGRINNTNAVVASANFSTADAILVGMGTQNAVTNVLVNVLASKEVEIFSDANKRAIIIDRNINIGTLSSDSASITGDYATALTNAIAKKNNKLIGSILNFTYGAATQSAQIITAYINDTAVKLGAIFNTYADSGIQTKMLTISFTSGSGTYSYTVHTIFNTNETLFAVAVSE